MRSKIIAEYGHMSVNHVGEQLCGDNVRVVEPDDRTQILVLADGMGSGVKANILSILTATMMSTMITHNIDFDECVKTIIETLPICSERQVAYSTFTVIQIRDGYKLQIYNYDNPSPFLIRDGKSLPIEYAVSAVSDKRIEHCSFNARIGDCIVMMSDGCIHAGMGVTLNFGWELPQIMEFMQANYHEGASAKALATTLVDRCNALYGYQPGDDTTSAVVRIRERKQVSLMFGPPVKKEDDMRMSSLFFAKEGKHIVAGGTTANIAARYLGREVLPDNVNMDETIPPMSIIEGVDLVTEGMVTLQRVHEYALDYLGENKKYFDWNYSLDGASLIASALFEEATDINFFVGCAVNAAYQDDDAYGYRLKMRLVDQLVDCLEKMHKSVKVSYF